jgi:hypothetical protein
MAGLPEEEYEEEEIEAPESVAPDAEFEAQRPAKIRPELKDLKFTKVDVIFVGVPLALVDIIGMIIVFFGLDDLGLFDILVDPFLIWYYNHKDVMNPMRIITMLAEPIPYIGALPLYSLGFWMAYYEDRHPKTKAVIESAARFLPGSKGAASLEHGPAEPSLAARQGLETAATGSLSAEAPVGGTVSEEAFGMPKEAFEELEEENFGEAGTVRGSSRNRKLRGPRIGEAAPQSEESETETEKDLKKAKEFELEKGLGGGQLEELKRSLENPAPETPGERNDLDTGQKAS